MDNLEVFMEVKKYIESVLGNDKIEFNDSVIDQIAELYVDKLTSMNVDVSNISVDDLIKDEELVWSCYDSYIKQPERKPMINDTLPIDLVIRSKMYNERLYGTIGNDEFGFGDEEYSEGRGR